MKIISVVGARPNFIKMYPLIKALRNSKHESLIVHTGQHYDSNMSDVFFKELYPDKPDYNLNIGSSSHGHQTGQILQSVEEVIIKEEPDIVIVPGDTNSTLGGALAARKQHIVVAHLEAGLRSYDKNMPEEINRILTDHCSNLLFCPSDSAVKNLEKEGITNGVYKVGDTMFELAKMLVNEINAVTLQIAIPYEFILSTIHRAENTTNKKLLQIIKEICKIKHNVIIPLHPRTRNKLVEIGVLAEIQKQVTIIEPLGFLEFSYLLKKARAVITDSGGVQKEAYWNRIPCITVRDTTEWVETIEMGGNILANPSEITGKVEYMLTKKIQYSDNLYGFKDTSKRIIKILNNYV